jgi:hypothetical protein
VANIVEEVTPSTVRIAARGPAREASGTGWVYDAKQGLVVTNYHVVNGGNDFGVEVEGAERSAELVGAAPCDDLAVVKVEDTSGLKALRPADPGSIDQGENVVAVGFAAGAGDARQADLNHGRGVRRKPGARGDRSHVARLPGHDPDRRCHQPRATPGGPLLDEQRRRRRREHGRAHRARRCAAAERRLRDRIGRVREVVADLKEQRSLSWLGTGLEFVPPRQLRKRGLPRGVLTLGAAPARPPPRPGWRRGVRAHRGRRRGARRARCPATATRRRGRTTGTRST